MPQTKELAPPVDFAAPAKVLVVDDQKNMRTTTAMVLRAAGHQVAEAEDGSAAVQRLGGESFDVVLTDLRMGAVDGLEVLRSALETSPSTQVIVMTAFGTIESRLNYAIEAAPSLGAAFFIAAVRLALMRRCGSAAEPTNCTKDPCYSARR